MTFLNLGPLEWLLILLITAVVVGIGRLPECHAQKRDRDRKRNTPR